MQQFFFFYLNTYKPSYVFFLQKIMTYLFDFPHGTTVLTLFFQPVIKLFKIVSCHKLLLIIMFYVIAWHSTPSMAVILRPHPSGCSKAFIFWRGNCSKTGGYGEYIKRKALLLQKLQVSRCIIAHSGTFYPAEQHNQKEG